MSDISDALFEAMGKIVQEEDDLDGFLEDEIHDYVNQMSDHERMILELAKFFTKEAIAHNEPRLFYASHACLAASGILTPVMDRIGDVHGLMDMAEQQWEIAQTLADEAIKRMLWDSAPEA
jgi:hypothetical protein